MSSSKNNSARCYHKCTQLFTSNIRYSGQFLFELEFCQQILEKVQISNLMTIRSVSAEFFHSDGQTDRHDEANSHFWQFCERI